MTDAATGDSGATPAEASANDAIRPRVLGHQNDDCADTKNVAVSTKGDLLLRMVLDFSQLTPRDAYAWMIGTILPRPIAWVSTTNGEGKSNLAPFSFFQGVTSNPPTLMFVPVNQRDGTKKDTVRNIEQVPEFVVNLVSFALAEQMNATSALLPYGESEFEKFGVVSAPSQRVRPARVSAAPVAFECALERIVLIGEGALAANVVFGRILLAHVDDGMLDADGRPDAAKLDLIGRMGGESYARTTAQFTLPRPGR